MRKIRSRLPEFKAALKAKVILTLNKYTSFDEDDLVDYLLENSAFDYDKEDPISERDLYRTYTTLVNEFMLQEIDGKANSISVDSNQNCCGLGEVQFSDIADLHPSLLKPILAKICDQARYVGLQMTQAYHKKVTTWPALERGLNAIVRPVYLGESPRSKNHIYSWMIPATAVQ